MRHLLLFPALITLVTAAGCGGGGGSASTPVDPGGSPTEQVLGTREVPGAAISVERLQPVVPGATSLFRVTITGSEVTAVSARIGSSYGEGEVVIATPVASKPGCFDLMMPIPPALSPDARVWASATLADGSVVESGLTDFALK